MVLCQLVPWAQRQGSGSQALLMPAYVFSLQTEIAKRLNVICAQLIPFLSQEVGAAGRQGPWALSGPGEGGRSHAPWKLTAGLCPLQHQQQVVQAVERAKQVTMAELNAAIGVCEPPPRSPTAGLGHPLPTRPGVIVFSPTTAPSGWDHGSFTLPAEPAAAGPEEAAASLPPSPWWRGGKSRHLDFQAWCLHLPQTAPCLRGVVFV